MKHNCETLINNNKIVNFVLDLFELESEQA